ncbi:hypothetical protein P8452_64819 [Trifolium repens]|nr:hypothetical protein P8452_64819 [Trifolium repens]
MSSVVSLPVSRLLENQSSTVSGDNCHGWANTVHVVGTCKGLLCLLFCVDQTTGNKFSIQDSEIAKIDGDSNEEDEEEVEWPLLAEDLDED